MFSDPLRLAEMVVKTQNDIFVMGKVRRDIII